MPEKSITEHLDRIKGTLECCSSGLWDRHYGKGLTADYARAIHAAE